MYWVGSLKKVRECQILDCALYLFRMGKNPTERDNLKGEWIWQIRYIGILELKETCHLHTDPIQETKNRIILRKSSEGIINSFLNCKCGKDKIIILNSEMLREWLETSKPPKGVDRLIQGIVNKGSNKYIEYDWIYQELQFK